MRSGAAAAGHPAEVAAALTTLRRGGNAVDAAVAGAFCACVVEPNNAGLAGYGHLTAWLPGEQVFLTVDHGPRAPAAARPDMFALAGPHPSGRFEWPSVADRRNELGALATGVPGAVPGLLAAHRRAGRLPLADVLAPAIAAADAGIPVDWHLALTIVQRLTDIRQQPTAAAYLLRDGDPSPAVDDWGNGTVLDTSRLAATLRAIAADGYQGFAAAAAAIETTVRAAGGILTAADIMGYEPRVVLEQPTIYRGRAIATGEDDVGHELFGVLSHVDLPAADAGSVAALHAIAEAFGHVFADAVVWSGDPGADEELSRDLRSAAFAAERAAAIDRDRAAPRPIEPGRPGGRALPPVGGPMTDGTTQIAVADDEGGMAVICTTIGQDFGCLVRVEEAGLFLNTAMANFDPRPGRVNSIAPGRMPLFGVPIAIVVEDGRAVLACGGSGGYRITSSVVQSVVNVLDHGLDAAAAVAAPRVWCQGETTFVDARLPADLQAGLAALGHDLAVQTLTPAYEPFARVSLVTRGEDGVFDAASDPGWHGGAAVDEW